MDLFHVKPHGSLYGMAAKSQEVAKAVADAAKVFNVPVLGMAGTLHEQIYTAAGLEFISEYYADLDYADDGTLIITREHHAVDPKCAAEGALRAVKRAWPNRSTAKMFTSAPTASASTPTRRMRSRWRRRSRRRSRPSCSRAF
jgi:lactam utilization protein B